MKTYYADPNDHDAVAAALLQKFQDTEAAAVGMSEIVEWNNATREKPDADMTVMVIAGGDVEAYPDQITVAGGEVVMTVRPDILTASGKYFNFVEIRDNAVLVTDIAHALSMVCRFAGHTREFYSVAQHSVLVSEVVPPEFALQALFHDATEAYIGDVTRPLKSLLPEYRVIEHRLQADIFAKLGLPSEITSEIKRADLIALATEQRDLMPPHDDEWSCLAQVSPLDTEIKPLPPHLAEALFLNRYHELTRPEMPSLLCGHSEITEERKNISLLIQHNEYIARLKAKGRRTLTFEAPCCRMKIEDPAGEVGAIWDTLYTCPYCESLFIKITTSNAITTEMLERA